MLNVIKLSVVMLSAVAHKPTQCFIIPIYKSDVRVKLCKGREVLLRGKAKYS